MKLNEWKFYEKLFFIVTQKTLHVIHRWGLMSLKTLVSIKMISVKWNRYHDIKIIICFINHGLLDSRLTFPGSKMKIFRKTSSILWQFHIHFTNWNIKQSWLINILELVTSFHLHKVNVKCVINQQPYDIVVIILTWKAFKGCFHRFSWCSTSVVV